MDIDTSYPVHLCYPEFNFDLNTPFPLSVHCTESCMANDPVIPIPNNKKRRVQETAPRLPKKKRMDPQRSQSAQHRKHRKQQQRQQQSQLQSNPPPAHVPQDVATVNSIEDDLHHLQDEWASIEIILNSLRNAFSVHPLENAPEELLDEVDRELSIAYDDLKAQVRHLARGLQRLEMEIDPFRPHTPLTRSAAEPKQTEPPSSEPDFSILPRQRN